MDKWIPEFNKQLVRKHHFGFSPSHTEQFETKLKRASCVSTAIQVIEFLNWELKYHDRDTVIAERIGSGGSASHRITISIAQYEITVRSIAIQPFFWDGGRNSKRVQYFILAFREEEKKLGPKEIVQLEKELKRKENLEDYVVPDTLPPPGKQKAAKPALPIVASLLLTLVLACVFGLLLVNGIYIIFLFELGIGLALGMSLGQLSSAANYTDHARLKKILRILVVVFFLSSQFWQYEFLRMKNPLIDFSFFEYIAERLKQGLTIKKLNTGWIGLVITWILQLFIPYAIGLIQLTRALITHHFEKVPKEVFDFIYYHNQRETPENTVRSELAKRGWKTKEEQDLAFAALEAAYVNGKLTKESLS